MQITIGSKVTMHFALRLADGTIADSSFDDEPVSFVVGDGALDKGLELALIGLTAGDRQTLTLMPGQAFGERDDAALQWVDRDSFPADMALEEGQIIGFTGQANTGSAGEGGLQSPVGGAGNRIRSGDSVGRGSRLTRNQFYRLFIPALTTKDTKVTKENYCRRHLWIFHSDRVCCLPSCLVLT